MYSNNRTVYIKLRKKIIFFTYVFFICLLLLRYSYLQIIQYDKFFKEGENNSLRSYILHAPRGLIFDRSDNYLVDNQYIYDVNIIPKDFDQENFDYALVKKALGINKKTINSIILPKQKQRVGQFKPVLIKRQVDLNIKAILEENKLSLKGLYFSTFPARSYPSGSKLTHVLGYLRQDKEIIGFSGLEKYYENILKGKDGAEYHLVNNVGIDQGKSEIAENYNPLQGDTLKLTIDQDLQFLCEKLIEGLRGAIIVMEPKSGEIYAMNSSPDYNLDSFIGPISEDDWSNLKSKNVFNNRTLQNSYPPGSIFKLMLGAIALEKQIIQKDWKVNCNGFYDFYDTRFHCWKEEGHGTLNLRQAIQQSCNIYFYNLMQKVDFDLWYKEATKFGFGKITGIDLPNEKKGLVPNRKYMNETNKNSGGWSTGHLLNLSIGQGELLTTPLQIINLINIIANSGYSYSPHLNMNTASVKKDVFYKNSVFKEIKLGMSDAVYKDGGTAYNTRILNDNVKIYGKTGTAQLCTNCDITPHAWFAGFIELKNGKTFSICVLIENGGKGSEKPTKISKEIFEFIMSMYV